MGWGGRRPGSGRKKKQKVLQHPSSAAVSVPVNPPPSGIPTTDELPPIEEFDAPNDLEADARAIWMKQAPHAFQNRTLVKATALAFERYCKIVVLERNEAKSSGVGGPNHRGLIRQVNEYELQFLLAPKGGPVLEPAKPEAQQAQPANAAPSRFGNLGKFRNG